MSFRDSNKCQCVCHQRGTVAHVAPCCCRHGYKRHCPQCARDRTDALEQRLAEVRDEADAWHARAEAAERRVAAVEAVLHDAELRGGGTRWVDATVRHVRAALAEATATEEPA